MSLPIFDFSLRGRKYGGRGWKKRAVVFLNIQWKYGADTVLCVEVHEMLHALLHKLNIKKWRNEKVVCNLEDYLTEILEDDVSPEYFEFWNNIESVD